MPAGASAASGDICRQAGGVEPAVVLRVAAGDLRVLIVHDELELSGQRIGEDEHGLLGLHLFGDEFQELPAPVQVGGGPADLSQGAEHVGAPLRADRVLPGPGAGRTGVIRGARHAGRASEKTGLDGPIVGALAISPQDWQEPH